MQRGALPGLLLLVCREVRAKEEGGEDKADEALAELRSKRGLLSESLSKLEVETHEILLELLAEFDRRYSDIAELDRGHFTTYFATVSPRHLHPLSCIIPSASAWPTPVSILESNNRAD